MTPTQALTLAREALHLFWKKGQQGGLLPADCLSIVDVHSIQQTIRAIDAALSAAPAAPAGEPVAWTLRSELDARETTCKAHLWFTNPQNSAWAPLYAAPAPAEPALPPCKVSAIGHSWDSAAQQHIPTLVIEFEPVPANSPNTAKGWADRDRLAAMLAAAPASPKG